MCQRVEVVSNAFCRQNMDSVLHTMSFKQSSCGTKCESNGVFIELCWCFSFCQKLIVQICLFFPPLLSWHQSFVTDLSHVWFFKTLCLWPSLSLWLNWKVSLFGVQQLRSLYSCFQSPPWFGGFPTSWRSTLSMESFTFQCTSIYTGYSS